MPTNLLTEAPRFGGALAPEALVGPLRVVVEEVLHQLPPATPHRLERRLVQQVLVQRPPEPLDLLVGLRPVGPRVAVRGPAPGTSAPSGGWPCWPGEATSAPLSVRMASNRTPYSAFSRLILFSAANITLRLFRSSTTSAQARRVQASSTDTQVVERLRSHDSGPCSRRCSAG